MTARSAIYTDRVGLHIPAPTKSKPVWSLGTKVDQLVFTAGQPGVDASGRIVDGGIRAQTLQAYQNLAAILEEAGLGFSDVAKIRVFVTRREDYEPMTEVRTAYYAEQFEDGHYPASTALVTPLVVEGLLVEIEAIAAVGKRCFDTDDIAKVIPLPLAVQPLWRLGAEAGDLLFTTGQPGFDLEAKVVGPDVASQTLQSLRNLESIVRHGGFSFGDVARLSVYLTNPDDLAASTEVRDEFLAERFPDGDFPAVTSIVAGFPPPSMRVEVEAVAARGARSTASTEQVFGRSSGGRGLASEAVRVGSWTFASGQVGLDRSGDDGAGSDVGVQTARALENVEAALEAVGASFRDIVHFSVYLGAAELYEGLNAARTPFYWSRFGAADLPASTAVVAPSPYAGVLVEFEATAYSEGS